MRQEDTSADDFTLLLDKLEQASGSSKFVEKVMGDDLFDSEYLSGMVIGADKYTQNLIPIAILV